MQIALCRNIRYMHSLDLTCIHPSPLHRTETGSTGHYWACAGAQSCSLSMFVPQEEVRMLCCSRAHCISADSLERAKTPIHVHLPAF
eukprot:scaffold51878_cov20-Tisochrysis_lutea.AAC.2